MDIIKAQENNKDLHEQFHKQVYTINSIAVYCQSWVQKHCNIDSEGPDLKGYWKHHDKHFQVALLRWHLCTATEYCSLIMFMNFWLRYVLIVQFKIFEKQQII